MLAFNIFIVLFYCPHTRRKSLLGMRYSACARFRGRRRVATSHPESIYSTTTEQRTNKSISCVLMNSVCFNIEHYHNTHSAQYRCTHYTLLSTAWCFQSVCSSVTPWCVILFSTNSSPLVHPPVNFPHEPHHSRPPPPQGLSPEMRTVEGINGNGIW
jgi:hypothetical protein